MKGLGLPVLVLIAQGTVDFGAKPGYFIGRAPREAVTCSIH
jgi:hypothetical protein